MKIKTFIVISILLISTLLLFVNFTGCGREDGDDDTPPPPPPTQTPTPTPPSVVSIVPGDGDINICINTSVLAFFSRDMNPNLINSSTFTLNDGVQNVFGKISYDSTDLSATFTPDPPGLSFNTLYIAMLYSIVTDTAGTPMEGDVIWSFTTGTCGDSTPPTFNGLPSATPISASDVLLQWSMAGDDNTLQSNIIYNIYESTSSGGQDFNTPSYSTAPGATSYTISGLLSGTTYYYVARAVDSSGNEDSNTIEQSVTLPIIPTPKLIKPLNNTRTTNLTPTFSWLQIQIGSFSLVYDIQIDTDPNFSNPIVGSGLTSTTFIPSSPLTRGSIYYWRVITRDSAGNQSSWSITRRLWVGIAPGDVNGDGYSDLVAGSPYGDEVQLFLGGTSISGIPDFTIYGSNGSNFGEALAIVGDLNGDGFSDLIIGAHSAGNKNEGEVWIFFGGSLLAPKIPDLIIQGMNKNDNLGFSIADAGDLNGDGYSDLLIGAPWAGKGGTGKVELHCGGPNIGTAVDLIISGIPGTDKKLGESLAGGCDLNNDGLDDFAIGVPSFGAGHVYVHISGLPTPKVLYGVNKGERFGHSIACAGDVNGDGYEDLLIGAPSVDISTPDWGESYLYFGGPSWDTTADLIISGTQSMDYLGHSLSRVGDINNDGFDDFIIGAPGWILGGSKSGLGGQAFLFYGGASPDATPDLIIKGTNRGDAFGFSLSGSNDVNGDRNVDLLVGSPLADSGGIDRGEVQIYYGGVSIDSIPDLTAQGRNDNDQLGYAVAGGLK